MAKALPFKQEDSTGLLVAIALHLAVVALLVLQPVTRAITDMPPRIAVSLASEVSLEATAPQIVRESRAAIAPTLSDQPLPPQSDTPPASDSEAPSQATQRADTRRAVGGETPAPDRARSRPDRSQAPSSASEKPAQGSRIGDDFLSGAGDSTSTDETRAPAATFGRAERAALSSAITRQLRPHWTAPTGIDAEKLVSIVSWKLNVDGTLKGRPTCRTVTGSITPSNRPQASLHCERAIRAVQLAAPFNLPEPFYNRWNDLEWQFDRRL